MDRCRATALYDVDGATLDSSAPARLTQFYTDEATETFSYTRACHGVILYRSWLSNSSR